MSKIIKSVLFEKNSPVVIKHRPMSAPEPVREPSVPAPPAIDIEAVRCEAEAIMAKAEAAAAHCVSEAEAKAEVLTQQAYEEAHNQGYQAGLEQGYQEGYNRGNQAAQEEMQQALQSSVEKAQHLLKTAEQEAAQMMVAAERQIVELALAIARKILAREVEENPTTILPIVKEALSKVCEQEQIVVRVNPEDYEMVLMAKRDLQLMIGRDNAISVAADHTVNIGGCVVETALGTVDARLDTKLELVCKAIREVMP